MAAMLILEQANAHFQVIIPADDMVQQSELMFWHPYEGIGMNMLEAQCFGVVSLCHTATSRLSITPKGDL